MKTVSAHEKNVAPASARRRWKWIGVAAAICATSWLALGAGFLFDVRTGPKFVLATLAAVSSEGMVWLTALVLGVNVYQARRHLWQRIRSFFR